MGEARVGGRFVAHDWRKGIEKVMKDARDEYGYDRYNGKANNVDFYYIGDFDTVKNSPRYVPYEIRYKDRKRKQPYTLREFMEIRYEQLSKEQGEVVCLGVEKYSLITTVYREWTFPPREIHKKMLKGIKSPTILVVDDPLNRVVICKGTIVECKREAHEYLRKTFYADDLLIITRKKLITCTGQRKDVAKTSRKTTEKTLVIPYYEYAYYGLAPE